MATPSSKVKPLDPTITETLEADEGVSIRIDPLPVPEEIITDNELSVGLVDDAAEFRIEGRDVPVSSGSPYYELPETLLHFLP